MGHAGQREEELLDVDQETDHVARDHVVEGPGDRQPLDVATDEVEIGVAAARLDQGGEREVDADPARRLKGREQRPVATAEIEHGRPRRHLVADQAVEILVVVPVPSTLLGVLRRDPVEVTADPAARAIIDFGRAASFHRVRDRGSAAFHDAVNDRLCARRLRADTAWPPNER
jgi:hypothetical protein